MDSDSWLGILLCCFTCSLFTSDPIRGLKRVITPAIKFFNPASGDKKRNPDVGKKNGSAITLDLTGGEAAVEEEQEEMIRGIFGLEETSVREIMVPRVDVAAIDDEATLSDAIDIIVKQSHSRIPLYQDTTDNIIGIIHAKDLLKVIHEGNAISNLKEIARPAHFIPESKKVSELLQEFQEKRVHLAIVVDEYGGTAGLVTIKDILEEIVGELGDEYDKNESQMKMLSPTEAVVDAKVTLDDFNEEFGTHIKGEGFDTVGGLVFTQLGKIPTVGDKIEVGQIRVTVLSTLGKRIKRVKVSKIQAEQVVEA